MRILWICPYLPWPTSSGGKVRQFHLLRTLAQRGHRITLLVQSKTPLDAEAEAALSPWLERLVVLPRRATRSFSTMFWGLFGRAPLLATINGEAPGLTATLADLLRQPWDVVQLEHSYMAQSCLPALQAAKQPFVLSEHNVESRLSSQVFQKLPWPLTVLAAYDSWRYRRWERWVLKQAQTVVAVTAQDAQAMRAWCERPVQVVENGVDVLHFAEVNPQLAAQRLLFIGNFEYAPNVAAVEWLLDAIMPQVWARLPEVKLALCGYAQPADWPQRWPDARIEWHGFVPDLRTVQAQSSVFIAPLRDGGGSKLKVLEALAAGLPLVSTREGVSGLDLRPGESFMLADDVQAMVAAVAQLLAEPAQAELMASHGRAYVRVRHGWPALAEQLEQLYLAAPSMKDASA